METNHAFPGLFFAVLICLSTSSCYSTDFAIAMGEYPERAHAVEDAQKLMETSALLSKQCPGKPGLEGDEWRDSLSAECREKWDAFDKEFKRIDVVFDKYDEIDFDQKCYAYMHSRGDAWVRASQEMSLAEIGRCSRQQWE